MGTSVKRSADIAIKKGQLITLVLDFYEWGKQAIPTCKFVFAEQKDVACANAQLKKTTPVVGLVKCHTVECPKGKDYQHETLCHRGCCMYGPNCPRVDPN